jgi:hypothetical protein
VPNDATAITTAEPSETFCEFTDVLGSLAQAAKRVYFPETDTHGNPNLGRFLLDAGRLPAVTDEVKPWSYRGWLIPYIQLCEEHPGVSPRYGYVLRTVDAGRLLDEPIPQCEFVGEHAKEAQAGMKMLTDAIKIIDARTGYSRSIDEFCRWLGFAVGVTTESSTLDTEVQEQLYRHWDISKWLLSPTDYLGEYMAENNHGKAGGFFPTPMTICTMMAKMTHNDDRDHRAELAMDPAVGTGRTLLAVSNYNLRLFGQDINWLCVLAARINLAIYAPWHLIPESFFPERPKVERPEPAAEEAVFTTEIAQPSLFAMA